mmetsp:Transcript_24463/g.28494  ORF Transcript_24463/g.28494 Transcript_24463/m.28494 type:complete len:311 (+) Transcript_24463:43-975(+)
MSSINNQIFTSNPIQKPASQFIVSLYNIIENQRNTHIITWADNNKSFTILKPNVFAEELLPSLCKHSNLASFIRQLNMYSFYKCKSKTLRSDAITYEHPYFIKGERSLLKKIIRKNPRQGISIKTKPVLLGSNVTIESNNSACSGADEDYSPKTESNSSYTYPADKYSIRANHLKLNNKQEILAMINEYLNADDDDSIHPVDINAISTKRVQYSSGCQFVEIVQKRNQYVEIDFNSLKHTNFNSVESKASLNSRIPNSSLVFYGSDYTNCQNLIANLHELMNKVESTSASEGSWRQDEIQNNIPCSFFHF